MTLRKCALCVGLFFWLFGVPASFGAVPAFMNIDGQTQGHIGGDSNAPGHEGEIEITSYEWGVHQSAGPAAGKPSGKEGHQDLKVTKRIDSSTPKLLTAFDSNEVFTNFRLEFVRTEDGNTVNYFTIELTGAQIMAIRQVKLNSDNPANDWASEMESLYFTYDTITETCEKTAISGSADWACEDTQVLRISDLNFDGRVNLLDVAVLASEWLEE
jgi:type VI secretion system secreted protein Hcp